MWNEVPANNFEHRITMWNLQKQFYKIKKIYMNKNKEKL